MFSRGARVPAHDNKDDSFSRRIMCGPVAEDGLLYSGFYSCLSGKGEGVMVRVGRIYTSGWASSFTEKKIECPVVFVRNS